MKRTAILLLLAPLLALAAQPTPAAKQEIAHIIGYLKASGCQFNRNGTWYKPGDAVDHLNKKYEYLLKKGLVSSAEDFIAGAATESSMSGKPYEVKCGANAPVPSGTWLKDELARFRSKGQ